MYLPNRIVKILANINKSYIIYYNKGKISAAIIDSENIKIEACIDGYCINVKGAKVILNDLKSIEPLLEKVCTKNKDNEKKSKLKIADSLVDVFSQNEKTFAVKYSHGNIVSIIMDEHKLSINKTSAGYLLKVSNKNIAVESFSSIKKLLIKMNIIKEIQKVKKEDEKRSFEQLRLEL